MGLEHSRDTERGQFVGVKDITSVLVNVLDKSLDGNVRCLCWPDAPVAAVSEREH